MASSALLVVVRQGRRYVAGMRRLARAQNVHGPRCLLTKIALRRVPSAEWMDHVLV